MGCRGWSLRGRRFVESRAESEGKERKANEGGQVPESGSAVRLNPKSTNACKGPSI